MGKLASELLGVDRVLRIPPIVLCMALGTDICFVATHLLLRARYCHRLHCSVRLYQTAAFVKLPGASAMCLRATWYTYASTDSASAMCLRALYQYY
eukprot:2239629-Rhodomonas_salina.1